MTAAVHSGATSDYRVFTVDAIDRVTSLQWIACADDDEARSAAASLATDTAGVEIWHLGRRVCKLGPARTR